MLQPGTLLKCIVSSAGRTIDEAGQSVEISPGEIVVLCSKDVIRTEEWAKKTNADLPVGTWDFLSCFFVMKTNGILLRLGWLFKNMPDPSDADSQMLNRFKIIDQTSM